MTADLRIHLFGRLCIHSGEMPLSGLDARRVQELLAYLLLFRDHPHPREHLADVMWGEAVSTEVRKGLRQALWKLQSVLRTAMDRAAPSLLSVDADFVQLNADADMWLDVAVMEEAWSRSKCMPGSAFDAATAATVKHAVDVYRGELLEGWYQDWCLFERERLQNIYLDLLHKLMDHAETHGDYEAGLEYGTAILRIDHARERTHRRMMRLHYLAGDRIGALRQYDRCATALRHELDVEPARRTLALREQIRADNLDDGAAGAGPTPSIAVPADAIGSDSRPTGAPLQAAVPQSVAARLEGYSSRMSGSGIDPAATPDFRALLADLVHLRQALARVESQVTMDIATVTAMFGGRRAAGRLSRGDACRGARATPAQTRRRRRERRG